MIDIIEPSLTSNDQNYITQPKLIPENNNKEDTHPIHIPQQRQRTGPLKWK